MPKLTVKDMRKQVKAMIEQRRQKPQEANPVDKMIEMSKGMTTENIERMMQ